MADFLFEIGLEEIPARMIAQAEAELARRLTEMLARERLLAREAGAEEIVHSYATPRRLAVLVHGVLPKQQDSEEQLTGPSWKVAFKDGEPTAAALAFARKSGVDVAALTRLTNVKGDYVSATVTRAGRSAAELLAEELPKILTQLYWAKSMHWRAGKPERFVRPVHWMVALLDGDVAPVQFGGITAGRATYGHRVLYGDAPIELAQPAQYAPALEAAFVLADVPTRRQRIRKQLDRATRTINGARWREDEPLVETVTGLTEWPSVVLGGFEREYLTLPEEVLVTVMRDHQKYFAVEDAEGRLLPHFLAVLNTEADAAGLALIRHGNERVLRARFNDARFFWDYDQRVLLADRVELLKTVTFQKDLGSYYTKTEVNRRLAEALAQAVAGTAVTVNHDALLTAVHLAKADLTAELVKEFTELQGVVGGLYARAQGLDEAVAQAIYWQYRPASADDEIPPTVEGQLLGLADRMATIVDMFALGLEPTGSKDPFALRRAANGVVAILAQSGLPLGLRQLEQLAATSQQNARAEAVATPVERFLRERLEFYLRETQGFSYDVVNAVLAAGADDVPDAIARAAALSEVRGSEDFAAISASFKRIKNILRQAAEKGDDAVQNGDTIIFEGDLNEPQEQALHAQTCALGPEVERLRARRQYVAALERIATLRPTVDAFFDKVMVMAPDPAMRRNRLSLIAEVLRSFSRIADFSEIVT